jgi:sugar lactone lactonase YvrE
MSDEHNTTERASEDIRDFFERVSRQLTSRREFMSTATKIGAGTAVLSAGSGVATANDTEDNADDGGEDTPSTVDVLNFALLLEHLEATFYTEAVGTAPSGESGGGGTFTETDIERSDVAEQFAAANLRYSTYAYLQQVRDHEQTHVDILAAAVEDLGGDPVEDPGFVFPYETVEEFIALAKVFEDTGAATYAGAVEFLADSEYLLPAARILAVETRHASYLRVLTLDAHTPHPNALQRTLSMQQVRDRVAPFIQGAGTDVSQIETLVSIPGQKVPENLGFAANGDLYFGITAGALRRLPAARTNETGLSLSATETVATFDGSVIGVAFDDHTPYITLATSDARSGAYMVDDDDGSATQLATIRGFPNDVLFDRANDRLLVTESNNGRVYTVSLTGGKDIWLDSSLLNTPGFGANGLTRGPNGDVFVAVTQTADDTGRIVRVPVRADGHAGNPETYVESPALLGADGLTARGPHLYVAVNQQNKIARVTPATEITTVASGNPLVFPSDVLVGEGPNQRGELFICNFATQQPEEAAILRTRL